MARRKQKIDPERSYLTQSTESRRMVPWKALALRSRGSSMWRSFGQSVLFDAAAAVGGPVAPGSRVRGLAISPSRRRLRASRWI